jgi:hypothetical protein
MYNSQAQLSRDFAIRQGAMRRLYNEGTGSIIVEEMSDPYQGVPRVWGLLSPAAPLLWEGHSATTGASLVFIKNSIASLEVPVMMEMNFEASQLSAALSPASVLDRVRTVFGLNITETAEVFGITRQTAYQWIKFTDMDQVRSHEKRDRLKQLNGAAQLWQDQPPLKGCWLHAFLPTGNTVLDLLNAYPVNLDALRTAYQVLSTSTADRRREEGERATQAATALTGAFAGLGAGRKARK